MSLTSHDHQNYLRRQARTRAALRANSSLPRLTVHRTLRHIYAQIVDDTKGITLAASSDLTVKTTGSKMTIATEVGKSIAALAKERKIKAVCFDRGGYKFHGRIAALANAARENGLTF